MRIENLNKGYDSLVIYNNFSISFPEQRITAILGPSGCGKTTLLNILAGLDPAAGRKISRPVSYVFQEPRLLPWFDLRKNIEIALPREWTAAKRREKAEQALEAVGLKDFIRYVPNRLSGGMRQRVSIARAFAVPSDLLLMDEPFRGLDIRTRQELIELFLALWETQRRTVIAVTHDPEEAWRIGDHILLFSRAPVQILFSRDIDLPKTNRPLDSEEFITLRKDLCNLMGECPLPDPADK